MPTDEEGGKYELFSKVNRTIKDEIRNLILNGKNVAELFNIVNGNKKGVKSGRNSVC